MLTLLMYFLHGALPWQGLKAAMKKQKYDHIMKKKMTTPTDLLCHGFPDKFGIFLNSTGALRFADNPDYSLSGLPNYAGARRVMISVGDTH